MAFTNAMGVLVALESAINAGLVDSALLHVEDGFGVGVSHLIFVYGLHKQIATGSRHE